MLIFRIENVFDILHDMQILKLQGFPFSPQVVQSNSDTVSLHSDNIGQKNTRCFQKHFCFDEQKWILIRNITKNMIKYLVLVFKYV